VVPKSYQTPAGKGKSLSRFLFLPWILLEMPWALVTALGIVPHFKAHRAVLPNCLLLKKTAPLIQI
jgi:hypothetical protein